MLSRLPVFIKHIEPEGLRLSVLDFQNINSARMLRLRDEMRDISAKHVHPQCPTARDGVDIIALGVSLILRSHIVSEIFDAIGDRAKNNRRACPGDNGIVHHMLGYAGVVGIGLDKYCNLCGGEAREQFSHSPRIGTAHVNVHINAAISVQQRQPGYTTRITTMPRSA
jgi:hypothetical protein